MSQVVIIIVAGSRRRDAEIDRLGVGLASRGQALLDESRQRRPQEDAFQEAVAYQDGAKAHVRRTLEGSGPVA